WGLESVPVRRRFLAMNRLALSAALVVSTYAVASATPAAPTLATPAAPTPANPATKPSSSAPAWHTSVDLDGDGKLDDIQVTLPPSQPGQRKLDPRVDIPCDTEPTCHVRIAVGTASVELDVPGGYFGGLGVKVIDTDQSDKRKELLITQRTE